MTPKQQAVCIAFGRAAREMRVEKGEALDVVAARAGWSRGYYAAMERGDFNLYPKTMFKIAGALGVKVSRIFLRAGL